MRIEISTHDADSVHAAHVRALLEEGGYFVNEIAINGNLESETPPPKRTYVVGVPLVITVTDDGVVTFDVDLSEAADLSEAVENKNGHRTDDDEAAIDAALAPLKYTHTFTAPQEG